MIYFLFIYLIFMIYVAIYIWHYIFGNQQYLAEKNYLILTKTGPKSLKPKL